MATFDHIHIYATDPEHTMAFYETHFGAERLGSLPTSHEDRNHLLILGGQYIIVAAFPLGAQPSEATGDGATGTRGGFGVGHIGINVDDLDRAAADLASRGVLVHGEPRTAGPIRYVYCDGPDGVAIELTEYVVPRKLAPALTFLRGFNKGVHVAKRALAKQLLSQFG